MSFRSPRLRASLALLLVTLVWGATFPIVKNALADCSALLFNLLRMALAAAVLAVLYRHELRAASARDLRNGILAGGFLALGYQLQTAGLARTSPVTSAFITGLVVVFVPLLSAMRVLRPAGASAPRANAYAGAMIAFIGLVLLTAPKHAAAPRHPAASLLGGMHAGEWLTLGCAVAFALHLLTLARVSPTMPAPRLATLQIAAATVFMLVTLPLGGATHLSVTPRLGGALLVTALLATALAFTIQSWAQQHLPATNIALVLAMEPVFAWLTALAFFGERLSVRSMAGAGAILMGILIVELWPATKPAAAPVELRAKPQADV
jgi:drug/metabolite transporter (DMT)-like permease